MCSSMARREEASHGISTLEKALSVYVNVVDVYVYLVSSVFTKI